MVGSTSSRSISASDPRGGVLLAQAVATCPDALRIVRQLGDEGDAMAGDAQRSARVGAQLAVPAPALAVPRAHQDPAGLVNHDPDDRLVRPAPGRGGRLEPHGARAPQGEEHLRVEARLSHAARA